jgi:anion-transporting  ArsA/GET3 family ATPase
VNLSERRLLFVTGKGGVGKSTVAAALARHAAVAGRKVLVCEADRSGSLCRVLGVPSLAFDPSPIRTSAAGPGSAAANRLFACSIDTEASLRQYVKLYLRLPVITKLTPIAKTLDFVATAAPGVREILTIGKVCHEVRTGGYDLVIVDAPSSGHAASLLSVARTIHDAVPAGPLRGQTSWMLDILDDPVRAGVVVVTTPEELPVSETVEFIGRIRAEAARAGSGMPVAGIVINRLVPEPFTRTDAALFETLVAKPPKGAARVVAAAQLLVELRDQAVANLGLLPHDIDQIVLPEVHSDDPVATVHGLVAYLDQELS